MGSMRGTWRKLFLAVYLACFLVLAGCGGQGEEETLMDYKTPYVGDNSKVSQIVRMQDYPDGAEVEGIEILSVEEPYGMKVFLRTQGTMAEEDLFRQAVVTFALIDNLSELDYLSAEGEEPLANFERDEVEEVLKDWGRPGLNEMGKDLASLEEYLEGAN